MKSGKINSLILIGMFFLLTISLISSISSLGIYPVCLTKGQTIRFSLCNPTIPDRLCSTSLCQYCINEISPGIYCPVSLNSCNDGDQTCTFITNQNTTTPSPFKINLTEPINNDTLTSPNSISFKFKVTNYTRLSSCNLFVNEVLLASNQTRLISTINTIQASLNPNPTNPGNYNWFIRCTNKTGSFFYSEHRLLTIIIPPTFYNVNLLSPSDQSSIIEGPVSFSFNLSNLSNSTLKTCNLLINNIIVNSTNSTNTSNTFISNTLNTFTQNLAPGTYSWNINCINKVSKNFSSEVRLITITSNAPTPPPTSNPGSGGSTGGGGGGGGGGGSSLAVCIPTDWNCTKWTDCKNSTQTRVCKLTKTNCQVQNQTKPQETLKCITGPNSSELTNSSSSLTNSSSNLSEQITSIFPKAIAGITGAVVGSLSEKKVFIPIIFIVVIVALMIIIQLARKKKAD